MHVIISAFLPPRAPSRIGEPNQTLLPKKMWPHRFAFLTVALVLTFCRSSNHERKIHLQWAICDEDAQTVLRKLGEEDKESYKANAITYYDTWPPTYTAKGLGLRTKTKKHDPGWPISLVKARFGEQIDDVPPNADCVWDRYGNGTYFTCGLPFVLPDEPTDIWSEEQMAFAERYQAIEWDALVPYGPFANPKWKLSIQGHKAVFDDVMAGDLHLMEIEIAVEKSKGVEVHANITKYLNEHDVVICEPQLSKTLRLLDHLEKQALSMGSETDQVVLHG